MKFFCCSGILVP